jgi:hypothetical protein
MDQDSDACLYEASTFNITQRRRFCVNPFAVPRSASNFHTIVPRITSPFIGNQADCTPILSYSLRPCRCTVQSQLGVLDGCLVASGLGTKPAIEYAAPAPYNFARYPRFSWECVSVVWAIILMTVPICNHHAPTVPHVKVSWMIVTSLIRWCIYVYQSSVSYIRGKIV